MNVFISALIFLVMVPQAFANACDRLGAAIQVTYPNSFGGVVIAGDEISIHISVDISDTGALNEFSMIPLSFRLVNHLPGSQSVGSNDLWLKEDANPLVVSQKNFDVRLKIPLSFIGRYSPETVISMVVNNQYCGIKIKNPPNSIIDVVNLSGTADITPPIISAISADKSSYQIGEIATISVTAHDQSGLCTMTRMSAGECDAVWHVLLRETTSGDEVNIDAPILESNQSGKVLVKFQVNALDSFSRPLFKAGEYRVQGINLYDVWGNATVDLVPLVMRSIRVVDPDL